ncbi:dTDP-4-dehydrorhamnose reductase [Melaminivora alkalimesophila]|uniref:dTDP-4-dehydrorhamnose reductase n=1 Tax=Melaminivora alkalimesophila TaxID=1165852 RepID=A0A317R890_9BURK|nr:dTDP-4-dehydrorhamnose reductase [Melaminivora alkalimesophila]
MDQGLHILLLGSSGQVGWELQRSLSVLGRVTALARESASHCADFSQPEGVRQTVRALRPDVIVNAAAHTAVDRAEGEPELARLLNATTPGVLAEEAARLGAWLVHYSTDYVFDGSGERPWTEADAPAPLSVYGATKLEGERRIQASGCRHLILRTSWVYAARGGNFARTMLRLGQERERLTVIDDQWGAPTGAELLADVTAHALRHLQARPEDGGLYHCTASGATTWHAYASYVLAQARRCAPSLALKVTEIAPVPTTSFPTPARRPHNSRLDCSRLQSTFGLALPPWQQGVARMLAEIL